MLSFSQEVTSIGQRQQSVSDQKIEQANIQGGRGVEVQVSEVPTSIQNIKPPSILLPKQRPGHQRL